jgi:WD40 repeat protein
MGYGTPIIWSLLANSPVVTLPEFSEVEAASFTPRGDLVATVTTKGKVCVWQTQTGKPVTTAEVSWGSMFAVSFSPDGSLLAVADPDLSIRVWEIPSGREFTPLKGHTATVLCCTFSNDNKQLLTGSLDGTAGIWNLSTATRTATLKSHGAFVSMAQFTHNDKKILTTGQDRCIRIWDPITHTQIGTLWDQPSTTNLSFLPDERRMVIHTQDGSFGIWDLDAGRMLTHLEQTGQPLLGHIAFFCEKRLLGIIDDTLCVWDSRNGALLSHIAGVHHATPLSDNRIFTIESDRRLAIRSNARPEQWWGLAWLPEFWIAILLLIALGWSLWRDRRLLRK